LAAAKGAAAAGREASDPSAACEASEASEASAACEQDEPEPNAPTTNHSPLTHATPLWLAKAEPAQGRNRP
jgi:hypothetical protein